MAAIGSSYRWEKLRKRILQRDGYLCQSCLSAGRITPANEVDHIKPRVRGGTDAEDNLRSLCSPCHREKSRRENPKRSTKRLCREDGWGERARRHFGYSIPNGVSHSAIPVVLVCGPPASGKTTYIANHAKPGDMVIDLDAYLERIGGRKWEADQTKVRLAFNLRDVDIRSLEYREFGTAWITATAPTAEERTAWAEALGPKLSVVMLDEPEAVCIARVGADGTRQHAADAMQNVIRKWWAEYS